MGAARYGRSLEIIKMEVFRGAHPRCTRAPVPTSSNCHFAGMDEADVSSGGNRAPGFKAASGRFGEAVCVWSP